MSRWIDADALQRAFSNHHWYLWGSEIKNLIATAPSIDIEPKRGEWIEDGSIEKCNQCGERKEFPHWNFCPNCGARMT